MVCREFVECVRRDTWLCAAMCVGVDVCHVIRKMLRCLVPKRIPWPYVISMTSHETFVYDMKHRVAMLNIYVTSVRVMSYELR